jgi:hypothetical protein
LEFFVAKNLHNKPVIKESTSIDQNYNKNGGYPMSSHFPNLLSAAREKQIRDLLIDIERIASAIDRFNDNLAQAGYPTKVITIRHKGNWQTLFFGQTTVGLDLQDLLIAHDADRFKLCYPKPQERRAA